MKRGIQLNQPKWLIEPGCVVLVLNRIRCTYELIRQNNELVINVPGEALLEQTHLCGAVSGRKVDDKWKKVGLTPARANLVQPPLVAECSGHLECRVIQTFSVTTHDLVVCEVVHASVEEGLFDGAWIPEKFHTLHYMQSDKYGIITRRLQAGK